jgi:hypothetical protein
MKELEYGKGYEMYDAESYLPEKLKKKSILIVNRKAAVGNGGFS